MTRILSDEERKALTERQRKERERHTLDRIRCIVLRDRGWPAGRIAEALFIDETTVNRYLRAWEGERKTAHDPRGGSDEHLSKEQAEELSTHLEQRTYMHVKEIAAYVLERYGVAYSIRGMTNWLHRHKFVHKKQKNVPYKADPEAQKAFIERYEAIESEAARAEEPVLFVDSTHPSQETVAGYGWILKGTDKLIPSHGGRKRMNICGAINLATMDLMTQDYETINQGSFLAFLEHLRGQYPQEKPIHLILDQAGYHIATKVREYAENHRIKLHYLPAHSPNLNAIERLWKNMKKSVIYGQFYERYGLFKQAVHTYLHQTYPAIKHTLVDTITDCFRVTTRAL